MSDPSHSGPSCLSPDNLSALAASLQEMAESLLALGRAAQQTREPEAAASKTPPARPLAEQRQYRLAAHAVRQEQELLEHYEADSLAEALHRIHMEFSTTIFLMKGYGPGDDEESFYIQLLGAQLERTLAMLRKACSILADYAPLPERRAATQ